jgi:DnaJ-class molecular chaperone
MHETRNYYQILGLSSHASEAEIKQAYRRLVVKVHPDKNLGSIVADENFRALQEAYDVLSNADRRDQYDTSLVKTSAGCRFQVPCKDSNILLYEAARCGVISKIVSSFKSGGRVQWRNPADDGRTALHAAAFYGHTQAMATLISLGSDLEARNLYQETSLHESCAGGQVEAALLLLRHGASIHAENKYGATGMFFPVTVNPSFSSYRTCIAEPNTKSQPTDAVRQRPSRHRPANKVITSE